MVLQEPWGSPGGLRGYKHLEVLKEASGSRNVFQPDSPSSSRVECSPSSSEHHGFQVAETCHRLVPMVVEWQSQRIPRAKSRSSLTVSSPCTSFLEVEVTAWRPCFLLPYRTWWPANTCWVRTSGIFPFVHDKQRVRVRVTKTPDTVSYFL